MLFAIILFLYFLLLVLFDVLIFRDIQKLKKDSHHHCYSSDWEPTIFEKEDK